MSDVRHLTEHQISASVDGVLQGASQEQVLRHLADCDECRGRYEELVEHHQTLAALLAHEADDAFFSALEADVETALRAGDALPRGAVVSVRSGPSKPLGPSTPRPTLEDSLNAIGPPPSWAPPAGAAPRAPSPPRPAPSVPVIREASPPPPRPAAEPPRPVAARPPGDARPAWRVVEGSPREPLHVFPDELNDDEADEVAAEQALETERRAAPRATFSVALALAGVLVLTTIAVVLMRRGADSPSGRGTGPAAVATSPAPVTVPEPASPAPAVEAEPEPEPEPEPVVPPVAATAPPPRPAERSSAVESAAPKAPAVPAAKPAAAARAPAPARAAVTATRPVPGPVRMCGVVRNVSGAPIARAQVLVAGLTLGAITDEEGKFCLTMPAGEQTLRVSALGHTAREEAVTVAAGMREIAVTLRAAEEAP